MAKVQANNGKFLSENNINNYIIENLNNHSNASIYVTGGNSVFGDLKYCFYKKGNVIKAICIMEDTQKETEITIKEYDNLENVINQLTMNLKIPSLEFNQNFKGV